MSPVALDSSVAVPLLHDRHPAHRAVSTWLGGRQAVLSGHAAVEAYSVLTRLPGDARLDPTDVVAQFRAAFGPTAVVPAPVSRKLPGLLAAARVEGGAVYDGLVGLAARENGLTLATRDARARRTYDALGVDVELVT